jgi:hypothetical protein
MAGCLEQTTGFRKQGADDILLVMASLWKKINHYSKTIVEEKHRVTKMLPGAGSLMS